MVLTFHKFFKVLIIIFIIYGLSLEIMSIQPLCVQNLEFINNELKLQLIIEKINK